MHPQSPYIRAGSLSYPRPPTQRTTTTLPNRKTSTIRELYHALASTSNASAPGPDKIHYRLIKIIADTPLGQALLNDIALSVDEGPPLQQWNDPTMVMIHKPNRDRTLPKSWRPIFLSNTVGKLGEKLVANGLQKHDSLFHHLQYGSRKDQSAIDAMMITVSHIAREPKSRPQGFPAGK